MQATGIRPDQIAFGTAVSACAMGGQWERALFLLEEMRQASLRPDVIAYRLRSLDQQARWSLDRFMTEYRLELSSSPAF